MNIEKLTGFFSSKYVSIVDKIWNERKPPDWTEAFESEVEESWVEYLNGLDCIVIDRYEILEDFEDIFNYSSRGRYCITLNKNYILVPFSIAERAFALGFLPESLCPESF